jgi:hypothetical protein
MEDRYRESATVRATSPENTSCLREERSSGEVTDVHADGAPVEWTIWPLKEKAWRSLAVILFLAVVVWAIVSWFGPYWILPSVFILVFFLSGFFFPTDYRLDPDWVSIHGLINRKKRRWSDLRTYYPAARGVLLSTSETPSKMNSMRNLYLPFGSHREAVMAFIEEKLRHER